MVAECLGDSTELTAVHSVNFLVPARKIQTGNILVNPLIEDVRKLHGKIVGSLQFGIELKDDVGAPLLRPNYCRFTLENVLFDKWDSKILRRFVSLNYVKFENSTSDFPY